MQKPGSRYPITGGLFAVTVILKVAVTAALTPSLVRMVTV